MPALKLALDAYKFKTAYSILQLTKVNSAPGLSRLSVFKLG